MPQTVGNRTAAGVQDEIEFLRLIEMKNLCLRHMRRHFAFIVLSRHCFSIEHFEIFVYCVVRWMPMLDVVGRVRKR